MFPSLKLFFYFYYGVLLLALSLTLFFIGLIPVAFMKKIAVNIYRKWSLVFLKFFGIKEQIHWENKTPLPEQFILISNHPSGIELLWLPARFNVTSLAKSEIRKWFLFGRIAEAAGTLFVNREELQSRSMAAKSCMDAIQAKKNLLFFPEGGCKGININQFLQGAFHISMKTNIPVLPVFVHYEDERAYEWGNFGIIKFICKALFLAKNRNAHLYIFDAFFPEKFKDVDDYKTAVHLFYINLQSKIRSSFSK